MKELSYVTGERYDQIDAETGEKESRLTEEFQQRGRISQFLGRRAYENTKSLLSIQRSEAFISYVIGSSSDPEQLQAAYLEMESLR